MNQMDRDKVRDLLEAHPLPQNAPFFHYGTAGFRYEAELLDSTMLRMGMLAALRSKYHGGKSVGIMVTASHNGHEDNGIKLADAPRGQMLDDDRWEGWAVELCNASTSSEALNVLDSIISETLTFETASVVHFGRDTRSHSSALCALAQQGAQSISITRTVMHGEVTTPMLHHFVMCANHTHYSMPLALQSDQTMLESAEAYYNHTLTTAFLALLQTSPHSPNPTTLMVDCACGVGAPKLNSLKRCIPPEAHALMGATRFQIVNSVDDGPLNHECGAEHVQKLQLPPKVYNTLNLSKGDRWCSLDGDGDRLVYFWYDCSKKFHLLDGDRIAVLLAQFLQPELQILEQALDTRLKLGVVQTAYANGNSTAYLKNVANVPVILAKTGVKFVHAAAEEAFDVGIYFEPNGHGTILFKSPFYKLLDDASKASLMDPKAKVALTRLQTLPALINQAVGDALSDMLLVEAILQIQNLSLEQWNSMYTDLPSRQTKIKVPDRTRILVNENETQVIEPAELQKALDAEMERRSLEQLENGIAGKPRCFVRPSGTEDVVRIYAEGRTQDEADGLAEAAAQCVLQYLAT